MESIISGHKRTVFLVTQLPGCSLHSPAPSQLHFQPCCSCSCSLFPSLVLCNFSVCVWLALSASSSPPLSLPLLLIVSYYHSLPIVGGVTGFLIIDCAAFQRQPRFTSRSYSSISPPPQNKNPKTHTHTPFHSLPLSLSIPPLLPWGAFSFFKLPICQLQFPLHNSCFLGKLCQTVGWSFLREGQRPNKRCSRRRQECFSLAVISLWRGHSYQLDFDLIR